MERFGETEIIAIHDALLRALGGEFGIRDKGLFASVCKSPYQEVFGTELYPTPFDKAAKYLFSFANYQIFVDGSKRTAVVTAAEYLKACGLHLAMTQEECYNLTMDIANHYYTEISEVSAILREHSHVLQREERPEDRGSRDIPEGR